MHSIYFPLNLQCILKSVLVILWTSQNELGFFLLQYTNYINEPASIQLGFFFSRNIWFRISTCISLINYSRKPVQIKELVRTEQNRHTQKNPKHILNNDPKKILFQIHNIFAINYIE